jgi:hypothetical protein
VLETDLLGDLSDFELVVWVREAVQSEVTLVREMSTYECAKTTATDL